MKRTNKANGADKKHLEFVRSLPCCNCGTAHQSVAHHLLKAPEEKIDNLPFGKTRSRGVGMKTADKWTLPLCTNCHNGLHAHGSESYLAFLDPVKIAQILYELSGDFARADYVLRNILRNHDADAKAYYKCLG